MSVTLITAFNTIITALNAALVSTNDDAKVFPYKISTTPKHPEYIDDLEFPYFAIAYRGEMPNYDGGDIRWAQSREEVAEFDIYTAVEPTDERNLSLELMSIVTTVRKVIRDITLDRSNCFRVKVRQVTPVYDPAGRWGMATTTIAVGSYDLQ